MSCTHTNIILTVSFTHGVFQDLMNRVQQLEAHVTQLRHIVLKRDGGATGKREKAQRQFDFNK